MLVSDIIDNQKGNGVEHIFPAGISPLLYNAGFNILFQTKMVG